MNLFLGGVERKVADVESGCVLEFVLGLGRLFLGGIIVGSALVSAALLGESQ